MTTQESIAEALGLTVLSNGKLWLPVKTSCELIDSLPARIEAALRAAMNEAAHLQPHHVCIAAFVEALKGAQENE